jgi:hypothetical protein
MATVMVRVSEATRERLRAIAEREGSTLQSIVDRALDEHERQVFWAQMDSAWAALKSDPAAWQAEMDERAAWDATLADGLDPNESWSEDGSASLCESANG